MDDRLLIQLETRVKPFVKWAGGKTWLSSKLNGFLPVSFNNYHEPFLGSGAVFFSIKPPNRSFLSDINPDLINTYKRIKRSRSLIEKHLEGFENNEDNYYRLRKEKSDDKVFNAARFIFLNKTCYNGIYRVNQDGEFNVPYGHNKNAPIFETTNLRSVSKALQFARIYCQDFSKVLDRLEHNDLVFLDPPYTVAHNNNGFIAYNQNIFTWADQERLAVVVTKIQDKGAKFILTNAVHESVRNLYKGVGKRFEIFRHSTITSKIEKRRLISEYVITNCV